jgi:ribosomal protein L28
MFKCEYCDKVCYSETALQQHKTALSHNYSCGICGKKFKYGESLAHHKRSTDHFTAADWIQSEEHTKKIELEISMLRRVELELSSRLSQTVSNLNTCETHIKIIAHVGAECEKFKDVLEFYRKAHKSAICQSFVSAVSSIMIEVDCKVLAFKTTELYNKCLSWRLEACVDATTGQRLGHLVLKLVKEFLISV